MILYIKPNTESTKFRFDSAQFLVKNRIMHTLTSTLGTEWIVLSSLIIINKNSKNQIFFFQLILNKITGAKQIPRPEENKAKSHNFCLKILLAARFSPPFVLNFMEKGKAKDSAEIVSTSLRNLHLDKNTSNPTSSQKSIDFPLQSRKYDMLLFVFFVLIIKLSGHNLVLRFEKL